MIISTLLSLQLLLATTVISGNNCDLLVPPAEAGETQAHGVILYAYPRSHTIDIGYNGCQNQWFFDDGKFRKLNITYLRDGVAVSYENLNINGEIAYRCNYEAPGLTSDSDRRCPDYERLKIKTFPPGCYSKSVLNNSGLNNSGSYSLSSEDCVIE